MKRNIRTLVLAVFSLLSTQFIFAGEGSSKPLSHFSLHFLAAQKAIDKAFIPPGKEMNSFKICSCEILDLRSNNYDHRHMAVLAEKTNYGDLSSGHSIARIAIEKEKKHLKELFYDHLKVINRVSENGDCKSLFSKLKADDQALGMLSIIDADIRR